jgi:hypothetical protein
VVWNGITAHRSLWANTALSAVQHSARSLFIETDVAPKRLHLIRWIEENHLSWEDARKLDTFMTEVFLGFFILPRYLFTYLLIYFGA